MSNANKVARYLTTIDSAQSYAINILVVKPMAVAATFFSLFIRYLNLMTKNSLSNHLSEQRPFFGLPMVILSIFFSIRVLSLR